jgi:Protein of unknown function (DUF3050)
MWPGVNDAYETLHASLSTERAALLEHPLYEAVRDRAALQQFMASHVFAVWDFMALLKCLQRRLTCVEVLWTPPRSRVAARLVNEIVLGEETDEVGPGLTMSHFELYVQAMREAGADVSPIETFVESIAAGARPSQALSIAAAPAHAREFVEGTLSLTTTGEVEELAASFLLGREDLVPDLFRRLLPVVAPSSETASLRLYLARHIEVDQEKHGPLARRLLSELCGNDEVRWDRTARAARVALVARRRLWDGVVRALQGRGAPRRRDELQGAVTLPGG